VSTLALKLREDLPTDVFTDTEVASLVEGTPNRRYGLVKRAIADGDIIQLRRGVYSLGKRFQRAPLNHFELAQKIYAPSYVSLESALSHHGCIPEGVYTVTSTSLKRSVSFSTPVGDFSYTRIPKFNFLGVERVSVGKAVILIASPTKALADYIVSHKMGLKPKELMEFLRIEEESWRQISFKLLSEIAESYRSVRLRAFLRALRKSDEL
jgi:predicted transcriptional regulator of viral defense system